ncbi:MAG: XdhC family protein, partial [Dehalococcoidales bacterium]|nr:XdhC family protein [Dehalococcoidales bacterium]
MNFNQEFPAIVRDLLEQGSSGVIASIISQEGSAPRHAGTKMIIGADGRTHGTIGGSVLEARVIEEAGHVIKDGRSKLVEYDLTNRNLNVPEMICGGTTTVMLDYLSPVPENIDLFRGWHDAVTNGDEFSCLTIIKEGENAVSVAARCLLFNDGQIAGQCPLPETDLEQVKSRGRGARVFSDFRVNDWRVLLEPVRNVTTLYCFGAGH